MEVPWISQSAFKLLGIVGLGFFTFDWLYATSTKLIMRRHAQLNVLVP
jgi:hypothetical protein